MFAVNLGLTLPPLPPVDIPWPGMHVLVVHFPIALLLVAPVFVLLGLIFAPRWQGFAISAVLLLALGTAGTFVAAATGLAARDIVEEGPDEMFEVMEEHEEYGLLTRNIYLGVTIAYAIFVLLTLTVPSIGKAVVRIPISLVFLVAMAVAGLYLAHTAHLGGILVHQYGVKAKLTETRERAEDKKQRANTEIKDQASQPADEQDRAARSPKDTEETESSKPQAQLQSEHSDQPASSAEAPSTQEPSAAESESKQEKE
ncbi:MAG: DUF2231 domain-containing protein [Thermogutta sp.]|jgi:uncharacterized membrane protein